MNLFKNKKFNKLMNKRPLMLPVIIGIVLATLFIIFVEIPLHISTIGRIYPQAEWKIEKSNSDELITSLNNYLTTKAGVIKSFIFDRGDVVNLEINSSFQNGKFVNIGDTIGIIHSANLEDRLVELNGNLAKSKVILKSYKTGEKQSLIAEARQNVIYEQLKTAEQQTIVKRMKELLQKNLISEEEYEIAQSTLNLYKAQINIAEAKLRTVTTGAKKEIIEQVTADIKFYEEQLNILHKKKKEYNLISPIKGRVMRFFNSDTLLLLQDVSAMLITIPIKLSDYQNIKIGQKGILSMPEISLKQEIKINQIDSTVAILNNQQIMYIHARINRINKKIYPGMFVKCKIYCSNINLIEYIKRTFHSVQIR